MIKTIFRISSTLKLSKIQGNSPKLFSSQLKTGSKSNGTNQSNKITPLGWFLLAIPGTTFCLGCWQVKRKIWKENLIKDLERNINSEPAQLPENLDELAHMEYRPVIVKGTFLHNKELYLGPRSFVKPNSADSQKGLFSVRDDSIGYLVITPFKLTGREETILVNRGWVSRKFLNPETRKEGQIEHTVTMTGVVRKGENRPQFTPDQKGNIYLYRDLKKMCKETGADPIFIDAKYESTVPGGPIGGQTRVSMRNDHLSYLITWYSLSAATAFMWYRQIYKRASF